MEELDLSIRILDDILDNDTSFNEALRKVFQNNPEKRPLRKDVATLIGCELRHSLLFDFLTKPIDGLSDEEKRFLSLALGAIYFVKRHTKEDIVEALKKRLGEEKYLLSEPLIKKAEETGSLIPDSLPKSSNRYLTLRYNTPEWVLKIWEHYGYGTTYKILKKNSRPLVNTIRVRSVLSSEELLNNNPDFKKTPVDGILAYTGKTPLRKLPEMKEGKIFLEKIATKELLDRYHVNEPSEVLVYNANPDSSLLKEIIEQYGSSVGLNLGVPNLESYLDVTKMIKSLNLKNVNFFAADPLNMEAAISRPIDLAIAAPNSSNFDLIREYPDYLLHFKKDSMDALFQKEKDTLEGVSKYVAEKGKLIYMIYTISKKEGHNTINDFLLNHKDFHLVEEKQEFPFEEFDTALYYCVLEKDSSVVKDPTTFSPAFLNQNATIENSLSVTSK